MRLAPVSTAVLCLLIGSMAFGQDALPPIQTGAGPGVDSIIDSAERLGGLPTIVLGWVGWHVQGWVKQALEIASKAVEGGVTVKFAVDDDFGTLLTQLRRTADKAVDNVTGGFTADEKDPDKTPVQWRGKAAR